ncbi:MAG: molybdopterin-guanine dinucleotide biosynthesis protein B [Neoaquamicrobium sediminum]|uniref:molybdopterin-guanine dinucleotide biosynthesis protein B n=1 Tax=Neoaquamicrobium sediminum TaxID=1849104 RepID=UPI0040361D7D
MAQRVIGIAGWKNSGKTTLTERLVAELSARGWSVSTVKRAHHEADIDREGTDSFRHRSAGASEVMLVTPLRWALMHELREEPEPDLEAMLARLSPCDLVIVEGYKGSPHPKIETRRTVAKDKTPLPASSNVIAIAADHAIADAAVPVFDLDAVTPIADFIEAAVGLR